jgi:tRNA1Val (adenine37-N6)-methyltransferase
MYKPFEFKNFSVSDDRCAMKIGTDGVLLGATVNLDSAENILDIGTGSGVIALMIAQRCNANIDAVELDKESALQAAENFKKSQWDNRLTSINTSVQDYVHDSKKKYDLIVCNPPFFNNSLKSPFNKRKNRAKHNDELSYDDLTNSAANLLNENGSLWVIIPDQESFMLESSALEAELFLNFELDIFSKEGKAVNRKVLKFTKSKTSKVIESLTIRNEDHSFTTEYMNLTKDFYLNF